MSNKKADGGIKETITLTWAQDGDGALRTTLRITLRSGKKTTCIRGSVPSECFKSAHSFIKKTVKDHAAYLRFKASCKAGEEG